MSATEDLKWVLDTQTLDEIEPKRLDWLWPERIPCGKITLFSGNADTGKTTVLCDLIARFTTGKKWPDGGDNNSSEYIHAPRRSVLLLNAEDDAEDTLVPRLQVAKANLGRIHLASAARLSNCQPTFIGLDDLEAIEAKFNDHPEIALMVIDPIQSYLGECDLNKEQQVRAVLTPLAELAANHSVTIIANSHLSKRGDVNALHRIGGAVALAAIARAVWLICRDHEDKTLCRMLLAKGNLAKKRTGMKFRIGSVDITSLGSQPYIIWEGSDETDIEDAVREPEKQSKMDRARQFLDEYLTEPRPASDVEAKAKNRDISERTLVRAKKEMGIKSRQHGKEWLWEKEQDAK